MSTNKNNISKELADFFVNNGECNNRVITVKYLIKRLLENDGIISQYILSKGIEIDLDSDFFKENSKNIEDYEEFLIIYNDKEYRVNMSSEVNDIYELAGCRSSTIMNEDKLTVSTFESSMVVSCNPTLINYCNEIGIDFWELFDEVVEICKLEVKAIVEAC